MDPELERILSNVHYMISEGAPESDLSAYLKDEGYSTIAAFDKAVGKAKETEAAQLRLASSGNPLTDFLHQAAEGATFGQAQHVAGVGLEGLLRMMNAGALRHAAVGQAIASAMSPQGRARTAAFEQRTSDLDMLAPGASILAKAAPFANTGVAGLGAAVGAIRGLAPTAVGAARVGGRVAGRILRNPAVQFGGTLSALNWLRDRASDPDR